MNCFLSSYKRIRATLTAIIPYKCSAFVAGTPLLQRVEELTCQLSTTSYPKGYTINHRHDKNILYLKSGAKVGIFS